MIRASISETKNNLSKLLEKVRQGETILIMDRKKPVARIEPVVLGTGSDDDVLASLIADGIVTPPKRKLDVAAFLSMPKPTLRPGVSAVQAVIDEREESC
jgi:prevent-host-death family protein